ncbi:DUF3025 domain-containing protein [Herbaspirillum sp. HC18]|nr:DUF3025 domain-containing protein [Herbaspirillum sp. HC18]
MGASFLEKIDWRRPWLAHLHAVAKPILQADNWRDALNDSARRLGVQSHRGHPIQFVPQSCLPPGTAYEAFISSTGCVPTRENLHDFFNALVWLTFPRIKVRLNALQAAAIERANAAGCSGNGNSIVRGAMRDAATLFDENAALLIVHDVDFLDALRAHSWQDVFLTQRDTFGTQCDVHIFGHALMDKLVHPYKAITAHAWAVVAGGSYFNLPAETRLAWIDEAVAADLSESLAPRDFTPLPILGVPGWWEGQDKEFYADATVFRPKRSRSHS